MKQLIRIFALVITLNFVSAIFPGKISAQQNNVYFQEFYDQLSPYGQWIDDSEYGYIWIPTAGPDFIPYLSNGYWVFTDYGWTWVSDYEWGWAVFHYGRWDYNGFYGWFWVPENQWGPSWVTWRKSEGYFGWAPMRPGVSISITFGKHNDVPDDRWIFIRDKDIERHDIGKCHISRENNFKIINKSTVINNTYYDDKTRKTYVAGPGREDAKKIIGRTIKPVVVYEKDKPGRSLNNDRLQIYRPQVLNNNSKHKTAPLELTNYNDVKRISERDAEKKPQNMQLPNNISGRRQQTEVNSANKIDTKNRVNQLKKRNSIKKENNKDQATGTKPNDDKKTNKGSR